MSKNPGATTFPRASIVVSPASSSPTATTRPSCTATSARRAATPVPSTTSPPVMTRSAAAMAPLLADADRHRATSAPHQDDGAPSDHDDHRTDTRHPVERPWRTPTGRPIVRGPRWPRSRRWTAAEVVTAVHGVALGVLLAADDPAPWPQVRAARGAHRRRLVGVRPRRSAPPGQRAARGRPARDGPRRRDRAAPRRADRRDGRERRRDRRPGHRGDRGGRGPARSCGAPGGGRCSPYRSAS